jgi:hypothetical protein
LNNKEEHEPFRSFESEGKIAAPIPHNHDYCKRIFINVSNHA